MKDKNEDFRYLSADDLLTALKVFSSINHFQRNK